MARLGRSYPIRPKTFPYNVYLEGQLVWFAVYDSTTGELLSLGSIVANPLPGGMAVLELASQPGPTVIWDTITRTYIPRPPDPPVDRVADLLADGSLTAAWASLTAPESAAMQARIGQMLGSRRYRASDESIDL